MPIDLAKAVGSSGGPALGQCIYMPDAATPIVSIGGQEFLMSGHRLVDEADTYPEVFANFAGPDLGTFVRAATALYNTQYSSAVYANGLFVAVSGVNAGSNVIVTSPDGITWTQRTLNQTVKWTGIAFGNDVFVAVNTTSGNGGANTSTTGVSWTTRSTPVGFEDIAFGNGLFVAITTTSNSVYTSPDGITWTARTTPSTVRAGSITYGNGRFVIVASSTGSTHYNETFTSTDGINWTASTIPALSRWIDVAYGNGVFVAVSNIDNLCAVSADGLTWELYSRPSKAQTISFGGGLFVCFGTSGTTDVFSTSTDGKVWTLRSNPLNTAIGISVFGDGKFVYINSNGADASYAPLVQGVGIPEYKTDGPTTLYMRIK